MKPLNECMTIEEIVDWRFSLESLKSRDSLLQALRRAEEIGAERMREEVASLVDSLCARFPSKIFPYVPKQLIHSFREFAKAIRSLNLKDFA